MIEECSKHVENLNKYKQKKIARQVGYLQEMELVKSVAFNAVRICIVTFLSNVSLFYQTTLISSLL
jgi:hypothetical protein